ncbi:MAG: hypothetical protein WC747_01055 [Candidatus Babeliales bacterium]|jgi:hypothetical protein
MIDTIILLIPPPQFKIVKPSEFTPSADLIYHNRAIKAVLNPTTKELKSGIYKPRLTLSRRKNLQGISEIMLTIEFSIPKLMFGNNIEELQQKDFGDVITKLNTVLFDMGVEIYAQDLQNAAVLAIHFSKNIVLTDGSTPFHFIQKIKETAMSGRLDNNQTDYRNAGHCFKYHCNSYEMVFYDKIYDLEKSKISRKRAIDPDNFFDMKTLSKVRTARKKFELLRMEIRLNKRNKIQSLFSKLNIKNDLTFSKLFRSSIARKVLLHYVSVLECKRSSFIDFKPQNDRSMLTMLALHNPTLKPKQIVQFFGLKKALETITLDELKKIIVKNDIYSWSRLIKELETIEMPTTQKPFAIIRNQIERYKPVRLNKKS